MFGWLFWGDLSSPLWAPSLFLYSLCWALSSWQQCWEHSGGVIKVETDGEGKAKILHPAAVGRGVKMDLSGGS